MSYDVSLSQWGICGVIDDQIVHLFSIDHALINMAEAAPDTAIPRRTAPIVWLDYRRTKGGRIVSVKCGSSDVIRRSGESVEALEGRAMAQAVRGRVGH